MASEEHLVSVTGLIYWEIRVLKLTENRVSGMTLVITRLISGLPNISIPSSVGSEVTHSDLESAKHWSPVNSHRITIGSHFPLSNPTAFIIGKQMDASAEVLYKFELYNFLHWFCSVQTRRPRTITANDNNISKPIENLRKDSGDDLTNPRCPTATPTTKGNKKRTLRVSNSFERRFWLPERSVA